MARRNLEVVVTVRDAASQPLDKINKKVRDTGDAAKKANLDFTQFNKTLFTTTAFVASFVKGFNALRTSLDQGAELDRLSNQYERVLGPKGKLFQALDSVTTTTIDKTIALQEGLKLANLGIVKDQEQLAEILGKAGTAAKMAGMDSGEGVKRFSDFLASGSVGQLEFLGLISRTNPALQAQMAILSKAGGVMGGVISTQAKLALGMNLLNAATKGQLHQTRDLVDIMALARTNFSYMRSELGRFLGTALGPVIEKLSLFMFQLATTIDNIRRNSKELVFLAKAVVLTTGAIIGLTGALGTLRLMVKLLSFAGIGLPALAYAVTILSGAFLGITNSVDGVMKKFEVFGGFVKGVWELLSNLDPETGMSKMSKGTYNMLKKAGLLDFTLMITRVLGTVVRVGKDIYKAVESSFKTIDKLVGGLFRGIFDYLSTFTKDWNTWWTSDAISDLDKFKRAALVIFGALSTALAAWGGFKLFSGILSKIPIIGKLFGGGKGSGPTGNPNDPIYTAQANGSQGFLGKFSGGLLEGILGKGVGSILDRIISKGGILGTLANLPRLLTSMLGGLGNVFSSFVGLLATKLLTLAPMLGAGLGIAAAGAIGWQIGSLINDAINSTFPTQTGIIDMSGDAAFQKATSLGAIQEHSKKMGWMGKATENKATGKVSAVTVPNKSEDGLSKIDAAGEVLKTTNGALQQQQQMTIENAMSNLSAGGSTLTSDEMFNILNPGMNYLKQIAENTGKKDQNMSIPGSRRVP